MLHFVASQPKHGYEWMIPPPEKEVLKTIVYMIVLSYHLIEKEGIMDPCGYVQEPYFHFSDEYMRNALMM